MRNTDNDLIKKILIDTESIAVVGLSTDPDKTSYHVCEYLQNAGYRIIPVNPKADNLLGERAYHSLSDIKEKVDMVYIFKRSTDVLPLVEEAIKLNPKVIWLPLGVVNEEAARLAEENGITIIMDRCMKREHKAL